MEDDRARITFLKFSMQCCGSPINRFRITPREEAAIIEQVSRGVAPQQAVERVFAKAYLMCSAVANEQGKERIDEASVLEYFLFRHSAGLERDLADGHSTRSEINDCKTYPGTISKIDRDFARVETQIGPIWCSRVFASGMGEGAIVAVHRKTIAVGISRETAERMEIALRRSVLTKSRAVG